MVIVEFKFAKASSFVCTWNNKAALLRVKWEIIHTSWPRDKKSTINLPVFSTVFLQEHFTQAKIISGKQPDLAAGCFLNYAPIRRTRIPMSRTLTKRPEE